MKNIKIQTMKQILSILILLQVVVACQNKNDYLFNDTPATVNLRLWDYLQDDPEHAYYVGLIKNNQLDSMMTGNNTYTLFIPSDEKLKAINPDSIDIIEVLTYSIVPTFINVNSFTEAVKIRTMLNKFALLEYNELKDVYTFDGVDILSGSPIFKDGRFYRLGNYVKPSDNLYAYISKQSSVLRKFIDLQDSTYFDVAASKPIGFNSKGTLYDSVFTTQNLFYRDYYPVKEELRNRSATFVLFTQEQFDLALENIKKDINVDILPDVWINNILLPNLVKNYIFNNSLQYGNFKPRMKNIRGDSVNVNVVNIIKDSRKICSNGVAYSLNDLIIPDSLYKSQNVYNGKDAVIEIIKGQKWTWAKDVVVNGLEGTTIAPSLAQLTDAAGKLITLNEKVLALNLKDYKGSPGKLRISFVQKGLFGSKNYRLIWAGSNNQCGLWKIYINGIPVQMRDLSGRNLNYFDSYLFNESVIRSVTGVPGNFRGKSGYNSVDFKVESLTEYSDAEITFEYMGPSINSMGAVRGIPGLVIDYIMFQIY